MPAGVQIVKRSGQLPSGEMFAGEAEAAAVQRLLATSCGPAEDGCVMGLLDIQLATPQLLTLVPAESPFPLRRWPDPPHVALVNLDLARDALHSVYRFTKLYGFLGGQVDRATGVFAVTSHNLAALQERLREAWRGNVAALGNMDNALYAGLKLAKGARKPEIAVRDLQALISVLVLRDFAARNLKLCASHGCAAPFFVQTRKGQKYCSHRCAVRINVRRFREELQRLKNAVKKEEKRHEQLKTAAAGKVGKDAQG